MNPILEDRRHRVGDRVRVRENGLDARIVDIDEPDNAYPRMYHLAYESTNRIDYLPESAFFINPNHLRSA